MGPTSNEMFRRVAYFVDKILKETKQTELPIERPSHFELFVNVKTAKALGLNVPPRTQIPAVIALLSAQSSVVRSLEASTSGLTFAVAQSPQWQTDITIRF
jgi:ABC-type uncharacterized transport system substrate-binding protein